MTNDERNLSDMIVGNYEDTHTLSPQGIFYRRVRIGERTNKLGNLLKDRSKDATRMPTSADIGIFIWLCIRYLSEVKNCKNDLITKERDKVSILEDWARQYMLNFVLSRERDIAISKAFTAEKVERYLIESKDYSRRMKVVVSRDGNGTRADHYKIHGPFLGEFVDDECAIKEHFCGWEEFLTDEDGRLADQNLRDVTVREVRLGKIVAKIEPVQEVVYKVVKK